MPASGMLKSIIERLSASGTKILGVSVFKHEKAIVESGSVGEGTRIEAFSHILAGAAIGRDCHIRDHTFIENDVTIGDRVTIQCGVQVWDGITVEDDVS